MNTGLGGGVRIGLIEERNEDVGITSVLGLGTGEAANRRGQIHALLEEASPTGGLGRFGPEPARKETLNYRKIKHLDTLMKNRSRGVLVRFAT
jgi:hypothetical protein